jgi:hypothetical protein
MDAPATVNVPIVWRTKYAAAYCEDGKMIIRYRFPYSRSRESALLGAYNIAPNERLKYYQTLSGMVERHITMSNYLGNEEVPSILTFDNTYQKREENGVIAVYCVCPAPITPLSKSIFASDCNALTALDVFLRLAHILRDINKTPTAPALRYLDMDDIYLTQDNKILLGGFYYATADGLDSPPPYLVDAAQVYPTAIQEGQAGDLGTDIQILSRIAWNIFSGLPWDAAHTAGSSKVPPRYAPPQLVALLEFGLTCNQESANTFRKQLLACRKELSKTDFANSIIPFQRPLRREYKFTADMPPEPSSEQSGGLEEKQ